MALTEKMKQFAREYYTNGGNGTEAYLAAYDTESRTTAQRESSLLLRKPEINEYIKALNLPNETKAINEREKKRQVLWQIIETGDDNNKCRALDILNRMDAEYMNINLNKNDTTVTLDNLDLNALKSLSEPF